MKSRSAGHWRKRWLSTQDKLVTIETAQTKHPNALLKAIEAVLSDLPLSHWTLETLQHEVIKRGIVNSISTSRWQVFLTSGRMKAA